MTTTPAFLTELAQTPYALLFAGQATPWRAALDEAATDADLKSLRARPDFQAWLGSLGARA